MSTGRPPEVPVEASTDDGGGTLRRRGRRRSRQGPEVAGEEAKDRRLLELLEKEIVLKARKYEEGGKEDEALQTEVTKKVGAFVERCIITAEHYQSQGADDLVAFSMDRAKRYGTEDTPLLDYCGSEVRQTRLFATTWDRLHELFRLQRDDDGAIEAQQGSSKWGHKLRQLKRKAKRARAEERRGGDTAEGGVVSRIAAGGAPAAGALVDALARSDATGDEDPATPLRSATDGSDIPTAAGDSMRRKRRRRKRLEDADTSGDFDTSDAIEVPDGVDPSLVTSDYSVPEGLGPVASGKQFRRDRRKRLRELKRSAHVTSALVGGDMAYPVAQPEDDEVPVKQIPTPEDDPLMYPDGTAGPMAVLSPTPSEKPASPGPALGPALPQSLFNAAAKGAGLEHFAYLRGQSGKLEGQLLKEKVVQVTSAVMKGREAQFQILVKELGTNVTDEHFQLWLRVASCTGSRTIIHRLVKEWNADVNWVGGDPQGRSNLHHAVRASQPKAVKELLRLGAHVDKTDVMRRTPLHLACMQGDEACVGELLAHGCAVRVEDTSNNSPLAYAMRSGMEEAPAALVRNGALAGMYDTDEWDDTGRLLGACRRGHADVALLLINHTPADVCIPAGDDGLNTPLHWACINKLHDVLTELITRGVEVNQTNAEGLTPLHIAAATDGECCRILLSAGANPAVEDRHGNVALHYACAGKRVEEATLLLHRDPRQRNHPNHSGTTPLHSATSAGLDEVVSRLLAKRANPNPRDELRNTPLHIACSLRHAACAATLIHAGASLDLSNHAKLTPLLYACANSMTDVGVQLLRHGCGIHAVDRDGHTAMHYAARNGLEAVCYELLQSPLLDVCARTRKGVGVLHLAAASNLAKVCEQLVVRGCHIDAKDRRGNTPLHYACLHQCPEAAEFLIDCGADPHAQNDKHQSPLDCAVLAQDWRKEAGSRQATPVDDAGLAELRGAVADLPGAAMVSSPASSVPVLPDFKSPASVPEAVPPPEFMSPLSEPGRLGAADGAQQLVSSSATQPMEPPQPQSSAATQPVDPSARVGGADPSPRMGGARQQLSSAPPASSAQAADAVVSPRDTPERTALTSPAAPGDIDPRMRGSFASRPRSQQSRQSAQSGGSQRWQPAAPLPMFDVPVEEPDSPGTPVGLGGGETPSPSPKSGSAPSGGESKEKQVKEEAGDGREEAAEGREERGRKGEDAAVPKEEAAEGRAQAESAEDAAEGREEVAEGQQGEGAAVPKEECPRPDAEQPEPGLESGTTEAAEAEGAAAPTSDGQERGEDVTDDAAAGNMEEADLTTGADGEAPSAPPDGQDLPESQDQRPAAVGYGTGGAHPEEAPDPTASPGEPRAALWLQDAEQPPAPPPAQPPPPPVPDWLPTDAPPKPPAADAAKPQKRKRARRRLLQEAEAEAQAWDLGDDAVDVPAPSAPGAGPGGPLVTSFGVSDEFIQMPGAQQQQRGWTPPKAGRRQQTPPK